jgi:hypothetical protein
VLDLEGLFRISANKTLLERVQNLIDTGAEVDFDKLGNDSHLVPGLLKKFFRELPQPVFTHEFYDCFIVFYQAKGNYKNFFQNLHKNNKILKKINNFSPILYKKINSSPMLCAKKNSKVFR